VIMSFEDYLKNFTKPNPDLEKVPKNSESQRSGPHDAARDQSGDQEVPARAPRKECLGQF
jgi:hypothetical protein